MKKNDVQEYMNRLKEADKNSDLNEAERILRTIEIDALFHKYSIDQYDDSFHISIKTAGVCVSHIDQVH